MHRVTAHGHPATPCHARSMPAATASRAAACNTRASAFRDAPIPHSCSVGTAPAVATSNPAAQQASCQPSSSSTQQPAALPWQPLYHHPGAAAAGSYHTVSPAGVADAAALASPDPQHHLLQQPQVVHRRPQQHQHHHQQQQQKHQQHHAAAPDAGPAESWRAQHAAAISQWRLLSEPGQDETSAIILSCSSGQQLLGVAHELLKQPVSKWHHARLAAMAAVLTAVGTNQPAAVQQQQAPQVQQHSAAAAAAAAAAAGQDPNLVLLRRGLNGNGSTGSGSSSSSSSGAGQVMQHWQLVQSSSPQQQQQQQQQQQGPCAHTQLACKVVEAVTTPCINSGVPALHAMRGAHLAELLHAVQLLRLHPGHSTPAPAQQQQQQEQQPLEPYLQPPPPLPPQQQQQRLRQVLAGMREPALLSAVHGCSSVQQLASVVALAAEWFSPLHLKAGFVQLARLVAASSRSSSSGGGGGGGSGSSSGSAVIVAQELLVLLQHQHLPALQPHHCASILWSMGQLEAALGPAWTNSSGGSTASFRNLTDIQQQLLQGALAGLEQLNPRVCAQLLHGAARLQLEVPAASLQLLQQHTQQQLQLCDPQALACMLWAFATLHGPSTPRPDPEWLATFYNSSWRWLQHSSSSGTGHSNGTHHPHQQQQEQEQPQQQWQRKDACVCFEPVELSALLTAACRLQLQPPSGWLAAVADSSSRQIGSFQQQELGLLLLSFARLQYAPPRGLLSAAAARLQQLGPGTFQPQVLSLLVYGMTRLLCWQKQQPGEQQWAWGCQGEALAGCAGQLEQWGGQDLALLAWSLGRQHQQQQQQRGMQDGQQLGGALLLLALVQAGTAKLLQQQFTPQGVSMLLWGLGTVLQANAASSSSRGSNGGGRSNADSSGSGGVQPASQQQQQQQQEQQANVAAQPDQAMLVALLEAASAAVAQHAKAFSGHELSRVIWGIGAVAHQAAAAASPALPASSSNSRSSSSSSRRPLPAPAAAECLDLLFCQLLDASDSASNYQLAAALQGFCWAQHPRGLDLLHLALQPGRAPQVPSRAAAVRPQELLLFLRACVTYKYVPEGSAWAGVVGAVEAVRQRLTPTELLQLLYLTGKLQMQSNRRARQRAAQVAAASAAEAAAAVRAWQTKHEQRRQARVSSQRQKQQALQHVALKPLLPQALLGQLVAQAAGCCIEHCSSREVSLMMWGVSHLQRHQHQQQHHQQQQHCQPPHHHQQQQQQQGDGQDVGGDASTGSRGSALASLLDGVYPYTLQQLGGGFAPGNLATLLYALHRLRSRPEAAWLQAVALHFDEACLSSMDGQSLAVLGLALAGLNWVPPKAWLGGYVRAVAAADRRGVLVTTWQRRCISNSLASLNPLAGHAWVA